LQLFDWLETQLAESQFDLQQATQGSSLCQIDRTGQSTFALKTLQGREYAYRFAIRSYRQSSSHVREAIQSQLDYQHNLRDGVCQSDPAWMAYTEAAIESFSIILSRLPDSN
jgi:hypothetical protein